MAAEHEIRVMEEKAQLGEKLIKLRMFLDGETYKKLPSEDRILLSRQCEAMEEYYEVLTERIERFAS